MVHGIVIVPSSLPFSLAVGRLFLSFTFLFSYGRCLLQISAHSLFGVMEGTTLKLMFKCDMQVFCWFLWYVLTESSLVPRSLQFAYVTTIMRVPEDVFVWMVVVRLKSYVYLSRISVHGPLPFSTGASLSHCTRLLRRVVELARVVLN